MLSTPKGWLVHQGYRYSPPEPPAPFQNKTRDPSRPLVGIRQSVTSSDDRLKLPFLNHGGQRGPASTLSWRSQNAWFVSQLSSLSTGHRFLSLVSLVFLLVAHQKSIIITTSPDQWTDKATAAAPFQRRFLVQDNPHHVFFDSTNMEEQIQQAQLRLVETEADAWIPEYGDILYKRLPPVNHNASMIVNQHGINAQPLWVRTIQPYDEDGFTPVIEVREDDNDDDEIDMCREPAWVEYAFPTCNQVHELVLDRALDDSTRNLSWSFQQQEFNVTYLAKGGYRRAYRFHRPDIPSSDVVVKRYMLSRKESLLSSDLWHAHQEALIMERMSSSPHILDIYSSCGTTVLVETMATDIDKLIVPGRGLADQEELEQLDHIEPKNDFTPSEKLQIALSMAQGLDDLHSFQDGKILHADVSIEQWLLSRNGTVKLNDFNYAEIMKWNLQENNYCHKHSRYSGFVRSPEELTGDDQNEKKDVYSFGNNIYTLLTGLWPFYHDLHHNMRRRVLADAIVQGKRPYVDGRYASSRSYIEARLVEVMKECWNNKHSRRPRMAHIIAFLQQTMMTAKRRGELQPSRRIAISMAER